uniref:Uncharacterized protein n=1 Tax=Rhizophora mucronata TaxID=61149 RepID=A0A2P2QQ63_RHIMU
MSLGVTVRLHHYDFVATGSICKSNFFVRTMMRLCKLESLTLPQTKFHGIVALDTNTLFYYLNHMMH